MIECTFIVIVLGTIVKRYKDFETNGEKMRIRQIFFPISEKVFGAKTNESCSQSQKQPPRCHDIQDNDIERCYTEHNVTQHNGLCNTQHE
jgi:hypothetical protein